MRFAYADPPYPGQAVKRYGQPEVDHFELLDRLRQFDAWALSTSVAALRDIWNLCPEARCAAWVKPWASNGWSRVRWSWEPVLFVRPDRGLKPGETSVVWDSLVTKTFTCWGEFPGKGGGANPAAFVHWIRDLLGCEVSDELADLFPGSGAVSRHFGYEILELPL